MAAERQYRSDDRELKRLLDELARPESDVETPGKGTLAEQLDQLALILRHRAARPASKVHSGWPGQRSLVGEMLTAAPRLDFRDCQALALRDVLSRLGKNPALREETIAAADPHVARRVTDNDPGRRATADSSTSARAVLGDFPGTPAVAPSNTPQGQAMWGAANARAVTLYRRSLATGTLALGNPAVETAMNAIGSGAPLDAETCRKMEAILGVRLGRVRIHTGKVAEDAAHAACAEAFTVGEDVFLPRYDPASPASQKLLLHELVHCCQWWQGRIGPSAAHRVSVSQPGDTLEREADAVVARAFDGAAQRAHAHVPTRSWREPTVNRKPTVLPATMVIGPVTPTAGSFAGGTAMVMRKAEMNKRGRAKIPDQREEDAPLQPSAWRVTNRIDDLTKSIFQAGPHIAEIGGEFASLLADNWQAIAGGIVAGLFVGAVITALPPVLAKVSLLILAAYGISKLANPTGSNYKKYQKHLLQWGHTAWNAHGEPDEIDKASVEFARMITSLLKAIASFLGILGSLASAAGVVVGPLLAAFASKFSKSTTTRPIREINPQGKLPSPDGKAIAGAEASEDAMLPAVRPGQPPAPVGQRQLEDKDAYPWGIRGLGPIAFGAPEGGDRIPDDKSLVPGGAFKTVGEVNVYIKSETTRLKEISDEVLKKQVDDCLNALLLESPNLPGLRPELTQKLIKLMANKAVAKEFAKEREDLLQTVINSLRLHFAYDSNIEFAIGRDTKSRIQIMVTRWLTFEEFKRRFSNGGQASQVPQGNSEGWIGYGERCLGYDEGSQELTFSGGAVAVADVAIYRPSASGKRSEDLRVLSIHGTRGTFVGEGGKELTLGLQEVVFVRKSALGRTGQRLRSFAELGRVAAPPNYGPTWDTNGQQTTAPTQRPLPEVLPWNADPLDHTAELEESLVYIREHAKTLPDNYRDVFLQWLQLRWDQPLQAVTARDQKVDASGQRPMVKWILKKVKAGLKKKQYSGAYLQYAQRLEQDAASMVDRSFTLAEFGSLIEGYLATLQGGLTHQGMPREVPLTGQFADQRPPATYVDAYYDLDEHFEGASYYVPFRGLVDKPTAIDGGQVFKPRDFTVEHDIRHDGAESPYPDLPRDPRGPRPGSAASSNGSFGSDLTQMVRQTHFREAYRQQFKIKKGALKNDDASHMKVLYNVLTHEMAGSRLPERMLINAAKDDEVVAFCIRIFKENKANIAVTEVEVQAALTRFKAFASKYLDALPEGGALRADAQFTSELEEYIGGDEHIDHFLFNVVAHIKVQTNTKHPTARDCSLILHDSEFQRRNLVTGWGGLQLPVLMRAYDQLVAFVDRRVSAAPASTASKPAVSSVSTRLDRLLAKSKPYPDPGVIGDNILQGPSLGGLTNSGLVQIDNGHVTSKLRYILTKDLTERDLGYEGGLRDPVPGQEITAAPVKRMLNVIPASAQHHDSQGVVRIGELEDGRPVALKTYYFLGQPRTDTPAKILAEAETAKLYSDLGIGPKFHGTHRDAEGKMYIVMDIACGDFDDRVPGNINRQTFADLEEMLRRLKGAGIEQIDDGFQPLIDEKGRMLAIDSDGIVSNINKIPDTPTDSEFGQFTAQRFYLYSNADPKVAAGYLRDLQRSNPVAYEGLIARIKWPSD